MLKRNKDKKNELKHEISVDIRVWINLKVETEIKALIVWTYEQRQITDLSVYLRVFELHHFHLRSQPWNENPWTHIMHFPLFEQTRATARQHKQSAGACCCFTPQPVILGLELHFCPCSSELTAPATESINTLQCRKCFIINPLAFVLFAQWHHGRLLSE